MKSSSSQSIRNKNYHKLSALKNEIINENSSNLLEKILDVFEKSKESEMEYLKIIKEIKEIPVRKNEKSFKSSNIDIELIKGIYEIKEITKSTNIISRNINSTFDMLLEKMDKMINLMTMLIENNKIEKFNKNLTTVDEQ
ncbi:MAG: hypothetical protein ACK4YO_02610, partial [Candidatus Altarchaeaceae archaeon]